MSDSRRKFLKLGILAALFAAAPVKNALGQSWKDRDANPGTGPSTDLQDPLANYTKATFKSYLHSIFQLHAVGGIVEVTLLQVDDLPAAKGGECFSLLFRGGSRALRQDNYPLYHPSLGTFRLFLVPVGTDRNGAQGYLATINRLSYVDALAPAPTRSSQGNNSSTSAPAPPSDSPATTPPAQSTTPRQQPKPRKKIRKPSWKRTDDDYFEY
jgi:hypothetical protein